jgi:hypothetical protein
MLLRVTVAVLKTPEPRYPAEDGVPEARAQGVPGAVKAAIKRLAVLSPASDVPVTALKISTVISPKVPVVAAPVGETLVSFAGVKAVTLSVENLKAMAVPPLKLTVPCANTLAAMAPVTSVVSIVFFI